jgi:hypothetical protein
MVDVLVGCTPCVNTPSGPFCYCSCFPPRLVKLDPEVAACTLGRSKGIYSIATFPHTIGAAVTEVEGGLHMTGIISYAGDVPPYKDDQLVDFMAQVIDRPYLFWWQLKVLSAL